MRKSIFTLLISLALFSLSAQQISREMVLLEIGTGTWCVYCPGAAMGAHDLLINGHPVAVVKNHNGDAFANVYSNARNSFYGITGYPTTYFDGQNPTVGGNATQSMYPNFLAKVNQRLAVPTSFKIDIFGSSTFNDYNITLRIEKVADYAMNNIVVHLVLTESDIPVVWFNQTKVDNVNRLMVPNQSGTPLTIETGETVYVDLNFTFNNSWVKPNTELVAFVQNNTSKEVMHVNKVALLDLQSLMIADFSAEVTETCPNEPIQFINSSAGSNLTYLWQFPGGEPATSTQENPVVTYATPGSYDVTLTIYSGISQMVCTKEDYITIRGEDVSFEEVPILCTFWDPYELTEGKPAGGTYAGEGVIDGYFHPQLVGIGSYEVTYSFTDEFDCTIEVMQTVSVDECMNIEETDMATVKLFPNPTQGKFTVNINNPKANEVTMKVFSSSGQLVYDDKLPAGTTLLDHQIDLGNLPEGVYLLNVQYGTINKSQRIVLRK
jgi:PKD repeat protein